MYVLGHLQYSTIQLHKHIIYAQYALNNSAMCRGEDEIHLCKSLCTADFAHENFGSAPATMHPSVLFPSSLLQGLLPVPPVDVPAQSHAGEICPVDTQGQHFRQCITAGSQGLRPFSKSCGSLLWGAVAVRVKLLDNTVTERPLAAHTFPLFCYSYGQVQSQGTEMDYLFCSGLCPLCNMVQIQSRRYLWDITKWLVTQDRNGEIMGTEGPLGQQLLPVAIPVAQLHADRNVWHGGSAPVRGLHAHGD